MSANLGGVPLPDDLEWPDEMLWSPVSQQVDIAGSGALIIEESAQLAGRPITLQSGQSGSTYWAVVDLTTVEALRALAGATRTTPLTLELGDGRTFDVRWRHAAGAVEARPLYHIVPAEAGDFYTITLRLFEV